MKVHRFFALAITCMLLQVCNAYSPRGRMRPLWRPTRSRQRDTGEAKRVERPVESGEGEPPLAAVGGETAIPWPVKTAFLKITYACSLRRYTVSHSARRGAQARAGVTHLPAGASA